MATRLTTCVIICANVHIVKYAQFRDIGTKMYLLENDMTTSISEKKPSDYGCSVEAALDVIGGKWKGVILFHLFDRTLRFGELQRCMPNVTRRMLTLSLRELEASGLVHREVYKQVPPKVEYSLTEYGQTLKPIITDLRAWGDAYLARLEEKQAISAEIPHR